MYEVETRCLQTGQRGQIPPIPKNGEFYSADVEGFVEPVVAVFPDHGNETGLLQRLHERDAEYNAAERTRKHTGVEADFPSYKWDRGTLRVDSGKFWLREGRFTAQKTPRAITLKM